MNVLTVLGGVACLSVLLGTGAWAEIVGGEPGTSENPKDNVPTEIQRSNESGSDEGSGSGPGSRSDALSGMKKEKAVKEGHEALEKNAKQTHEGGAAVAAEDLEQQGEEKLSHKGGAAKTAEGLKEKGEESPHDISAQSSHKGMKKDMKKEIPENELQQGDPVEKE